MNDKKYEFFKLRQLASLLHVVRKMFSHGGRDVEFLVDGAAHPLLAITLGVKSMWNFFRRKFSWDPPTSTFEELSETLRLIVQTEFQHSGPFGRSIMRESDATFFDAQDNGGPSLEIDHRPTGPVLPRPVSQMYDGFQAVLDGVSTDGQKQANVSLILGGKKMDIKVSGSDAKKCFSIGHISRIVNGAQPREKFKWTDVMIDAATRRELLAIKLAGDWSQVQNCARYGKVFVTHDKMAATYAYSRGVPFIYFSRDCRLASDESSETFDDFFRYTFLCSAAAAARQSLA